MCVVLSSGFTTINKPVNCTFSILVAYTSYGRRWIPNVKQLLQVYIQGQYFI